MSGFEIPDWATPRTPAAPPPDPIVTREEKIANDTRVEQSLNRFIAGKQAALFEAPDAFYRAQGEDAIHAAPVTTQKLDELRRDLLDRLGNDTQRQRLVDALDAQMHLTREGMSRHVAEQSLAWQRGVAQDRIALLAKEAAHHHNDNELIDALGHAAATAARARSRVGDGPPGGETEDAAAATARSGVLGAAIQARLDRRDTEGANALFTQVQDQLDPEHAAPLQGQIDAAENAARQTEPGPPDGLQAEVDAPVFANEGEVLSDASPEPITDGQRYAQNGGSPPSRRVGPGGRDITPREAMRQDFFARHRSELERLEPANPKLSYVVPPGWVPSQRNVDEMAQETSNARARAVDRSRPGVSAESRRNSELEVDPKLSPSERAAANLKAGRQYEQDFNDELQRDKLEIGPQLTLETPSGARTRLDFVTRHPTSGEIRCIECKASETAPLTRNQREAFPEIGAEGATVKGAGKPGFPGGTSIPPTNVEIMRKR